MAKTIEFCVDYSEDEDEHGYKLNALVGGILRVCMEYEWVEGVTCGSDSRTADIEARLQAALRCVLRTAHYHAGRGESVDAGKLAAHIKEHMDPFKKLAC